jgi:hypothetical protein
VIIETAKGLLDTNHLEVKDVVETGDNGVPFRKIATEYRLDGELVRRDVSVTALRGIESQSIQGKIGG